MTSQEPAGARRYLLILVIAIACHLAIHNSAPKIAEHLLLTLMSLRGETEPTLTEVKCGQKYDNGILRLFCSPDLGTDAKEAREKQRQLSNLTELIQYSALGLFSLMYAAAVTALLCALSPKNSKTPKSESDGSSPLYQRLKLRLHSVAASTGLSDAAARRKLRQAELEFRTLKNLFENGLISEEMFEREKTKLSHSISQQAQLPND